MEAQVGCGHARHAGAHACVAAGRGGLGVCGGDGASARTAAPRPCGWGRLTAGLMWVDTSRSGDR